MNLINWFYEFKTPTVSYRYVREHNCVYSANLAEKDDYVYYWEGDFRTGREVKVKSIEILRHRLMEKELDICNLHYQLDDMERDLNCLAKELAYYEEREKVEEYK